MTNAIPTPRNGGAPGSAPPITHVSDTAFWVAHYRAKETARKDALFHDRFASRLVDARGANIALSLGGVSPYVEWSVVSRTVIIDRFIARLVADGVDGVINLGAGLDARPYRLPLPPAVEWVEVDYPDVLAYKAAVLEGESPTCTLTRVAADLSRVEERQRVLRAALPRAKRILVLTEGVLLYLTEEEVSALGRDLLAEPRIAYWIAEYMNPRVYPHLRRPARSAAMQRAPFRFFPDDYHGFFRALGWRDKETCFSGDIAREFGRKPPMPRLAALLYPLMPRAMKEQGARMTGFTLFQRAAEAL